MALEVPENILSTILTKRIEGLGYSSLKKFYEDRRELDCSYELLRQVVYGGRVPRSETLLRILRAMRFSGNQVQKLMEMHFGGFVRQDRGEPPAVLSDAEDGAAPAAPGKATDGPEGATHAPSPVGDGERQAPALILHDPSEVAASLSRCLPRIAMPGNEDFWEMVRQLTAIAERKVVELARRTEEQPLLFGREPEAVYHFLVRRAKVPPYLSRGEHIPLAFVDGIDYEDRCRGALLGAAAGEMLGRPAQGLSARDIQELYGGIAGYAPLQSRGTRQEAGHLPLPGCLVLARALIRSGRVDPEEIAVAFAAAASRTAAEGEHAANLMERGYPWFDAGVNAAESVPAARIAPVSLLRAGDFRGLKLSAGLVAAVTHPNPAAIAGAVAQAAAVARILHTPRGTLDVLGFARGISPAIAGIEPDRAARSRQSRQFPTLFRRLGTELAALLLRRAEIEEIREALGNGVPVHEGLPFAWACFLRAPEDFAEAVLPAINLGNDAEGTASMAGALCGAYVGASGIPDRFLSGIPWREELAAAAEGLLSLGRKDSGRSSS